MTPLLVLVNRSRPDGRWFVGAFLEASEIIVRHWGPCWAKRAVAGRPLGVWLLTGLWLATPVVVGALVLG